MELTQKLADLAFLMEKYSVDAASILLPAAGGKSTDLIGADGFSRFHLNVIRSAREVKQMTINLRYRKKYSIRRLDFCRNHNNPNESSPDPVFAPYVGYRFRREDHLHFYFEGASDSWAIPLAHFDELAITPDNVLRKHAYS